VTGLRAAATVAVNTVQESARSRFFALCLVFGGVVLYASLVLGLLAADQEPRVLLDFGLSLIELLGLAAAVYGSATIVLREMETKTIYLILTRPVSRPAYLLGRFLGLMAATAAAMIVMSCLHLAILFAKGWAWTPAYVAAVFGSFLKVFVVAALTLFLALFSSSILTALVIALILWTLGHFLAEIRYMIRWGSGLGVMAPLHALSYVIPDLQLLNVRDRLAGPRPLLAPLGYAAAYAAVWLALAAAKFSRKEF